MNEECLHAMLTDTIPGVIGGYADRITAFVSQQLEMAAALYTDDLATLRAENERLREVTYPLLDELHEYIVETGRVICCVCEHGAVEQSGIGHRDLCPVGTARAALEGTGSEGLVNYSLKHINTIHELQTELAALRAENERLRELVRRGAEWLPYVTATLYPAAENRYPDPKHERWASVHVGRAHSSLVGLQAYITDCSAALEADK